MNRILFAGGGTAGHIEPAWACSQSWLAKHPGDEVAFLGTKNGLEVTLIPDRGGKLFLIPKVTAPRKINMQAIFFPFKLINSIIQTISVVKRYDIVVGFGGYVAASAYFAAIVMNKPIVIHEQNAKVGLANRFGARFASEVAVAYPIAAIKLNFAKSVTIVGNPLRQEIVDAALKAQADWSAARLEAKRKLGVSGPIVLILGGSSGSQAINKVISNFKFEGCTAIHSIGKENELPATTDNYRPLSYIQDMATSLLASDLVISRSGAIATAEFAALGRYALFIPLPIGNGEQALNADELVKAKRAEIIQQRDFTPEWLQSNLSRLLKKGSEEAFGTLLNASEQITECIERVLR